MGNMTVINANYDVKTAITRDMKKSLTRVSNDLVCEEFDMLTKGVLNCQFLNFKPKSKWKKIEITLEKGFILAPRKFFKQIFRYKTRNLRAKSWNFPLKSYTVRAEWPVWRKL